MCFEWKHVARTRVIVHPKSLPHSCISPVREGMGKEVSFEWKHEAGSGKPVLVQPKYLPSLFRACRRREERGVW